MKYTLKKIILMLVTMILVSFLTFAAFEIVSGDPAQAMLGTEATPARLEALREQLGLNRPFPVRYLSWLGGLFTGDLGISYSYRQPVWDLIAPKIEVTLWLCLISFILITAISIPLGIWSYRRTGKIWDFMHPAYPGDSA